MSNFPDAHKVYDLAAVFRERVIEQGRSFLWPDQEIWTVENAKAAYEWFLQNLDPKAFTIYDLGQKGREHSVTTAMLAADSYAISVLTPNYTSAVVRERLAEQSQLPGVLPPDPATMNLLLDVHRVKVPLTDFHYGGHWPQRVTVVLGILFALVAEDIDTSSTYTEIHNAIIKHLGPEVGKHVRGLMESLCLLFPEAIPPTSGWEATHRIIKRYQHVLGDIEGTSDQKELRSVADNERLKRIYHSVSPGRPFTDSAFYDSGIIEEWETYLPNVEKFRNWRPGQTTAFPPAEKVIGLSHHVRARPDVYKIAELFSRRVLRQRRSLLWPTEEVWTDEAIEEFLTGFKEMPVEKGKSWLQVYENQFANRSPNSARILADSYAFLMQFASLDVIGAATKANTLRTITSWAPESEPESVTLETVVTGFGIGVGSPGRYFSNNVQYQLAFVPSFVRNLSRAPEGCWVR